MKYKILLYIYPKNIIYSKKSNLFFHNIIFNLLIHPIIWKIKLENFK